LAHYILIDVVVQDISPELATYIEAKDFRRLPELSELELEREYEALGEKVLASAIKPLNRMIAYVRSVKGQYWLLPYEIDLNIMHSSFASFEAKGSIDAGNRFRFQPTRGDSITLVVGASDRYVSESDWEKLEKFVVGSERTPLVADLLAGAERLAGNGYSRSALTEAVTALEVAISEFARSSEKVEHLGKAVGPRVGVDSFKRQVEHMGLSGTVNYLLPIVFPESVLSSEVIAGCKDAVTTRQNVVHNGQREVSDLHRYISCIKACCRALQEY
jgi:hypothetical protein